MKVIKPVIEVHLQSGNNRKDIWSRQARANKKFPKILPGLDEWTTAQNEQTKSLSQMVSQKTM